MIEAIIFDFDGVILESGNVKINALKTIFSKYGDVVVNKVISHHKNNGGISRFEKIRFYHKEFLGINLSNKQLFELINVFSKNVMQNVLKTDLVLGVEDFIKSNQQKYKMFISSGTPTTELVEILKIKKINNYFDEVFGSPQNKNEHIKNILTKYKLFPQNVLFIGDAIADKKVAENNFLNFIVRISENSQLKQEKYQINNFNEIYEVIDKINMSDLIC